MKLSDSDWSSPHPPALPVFPWPSASLWLQRNRIGSPGGGQGIFQEGGGVPPRSNEISAKMGNVGPLKYALGGQ